MAELQPNHAHSAPQPLPSHKKFKNLIGHSFGRLTVRSFAGMKGSRGAAWICDCDCGEERVILAVSLIGGNTASCGCLSSDAVKTRNHRHGFAARGKKPPEYYAWQHMIARCYRPTSHHYHRYGGRGIVVCDKWKRDFNAFYRDMGPRPTSQHQIDRINNDGNYEPDNCRWAVRTVNCRNRSTNRILTLGDKSLCIADWADEVGIRAKIISERINAGWSVHDALTRPVKR